jgi:hypothetical protein
VFLSSAGASIVLKQQGPIRRGYGDPSSQLKDWQRDAEETENQRPWKFDDDQEYNRRDCNFAGQLAVNNSRLIAHQSKKAVNASRNDIQTDFGCMLSDYDLGVSTGLFDSARPSFTD